MYRFLRALIVRPVILGWFRVRVTGLENVPRRGPVILASNHLAFIDSIFLPAVVKRRMTYLVASTYYEKSGALGRLMGWFLTQVGQLPLDRSGGSASKVALETGLQVLSENGLIGIYPEGTRSKDGKMHRGRTGVARLVLASGVPVVPIALAGTDHLFGRGSACRVDRWSRSTSAARSPSRPSRAITTPAVSAPSPTRSCTRSAA
ncbi:hypothetical protein GCM10025867_21720 [Frondihabitans sucicola]|uniref:Phospholipid/glycerol acyltransferase domain-containing protein n=1 Tax=Frondihabitans sucicola TaxID=1268041 RepID=A0ABM8GNW6_9MICO|nr:lysophospholipid acyltransferase family protein [Frondihabitans sucicola]BDZ49931.1 hypothetical protein GCM10025867_21720 [Frondihabitans sucicola]